MPRSQASNGLSALILSSQFDIVPTSPPPISSRRACSKQQAGHVARPRNAFIIFRCAFVAAGRVPVDVESDHRNISRIAGKVWRAMDDEQRAPWLRLASVERERHARAHPGYRYAPGSTVSKGRRNPQAANGRVKVEEDAENDPSGAGRKTEGKSKERRDGHRRSIAGPSMKTLPPAFPPVDPDAKAALPVSIAAQDLAHPVLAPDGYISSRRVSSCPPLGALPFRPLADPYATLIGSQDDHFHRQISTPLEFPISHSEYIPAAISTPSLPMFLSHMPASPTLDQVWGAFPTVIEPRLGIAGEDPVGPACHPTSALHYDSLGRTIGYTFTGGTSNADEMDRPSNAWRFDS
ncbi:hypothetical protein HGRIS_011061 [Hohenbuehelia grisea]|uniref:HMG box domain-containing protein n=1 Tax=Hohenbuehelia grisea TaxID=104357 RepID=A0ABR3IZ69_9AGAR